MIADVSLPAAAATTVLNLALAGVAGALAARHWLGGIADVAARPLRRAQPAAWITLAAAALVLLLDLAARLTDTGILSAWRGAWLLATGTFSGRALACVIVLALIAAPLTASVRSAGLAALAVIGAIRAASGHAGEAGSISLVVLVEWAHLLAMSLWVGCVIVSGWIVLPRLAHAGAAAPARYAQRMSRWAGAALAVIVGTGIFNTGRVLGQWSDLVRTEYGMLLLAKIALVLAAIGLGALNRFGGLAALRHMPVEASALRRFVLVLRIESLVLAAAVLAAGVLSNAAPRE